MKVREKRHTYTLLVALQSGSASRCTLTIAIKMGNIIGPEMLGTYTTKTLTPAQGQMNIAIANLVI